MCTAEPLSCKDLGERRPVLDGSFCSSREVLRLEHCGLCVMVLLPLLQSCVSTHTGEHVAKGQRRGLAWWGKSYQVVRTEVHKVRPEQNLPAVLLTASLIHALILLQTDSFWNPGYWGSVKQSDMTPAVRSPLSDKGALNACSKMISIIKNGVL